MKTGFEGYVQRGALTLVLLLTAAVASAQDKDNKIIFAPYLWGTSISGTSTVGALPPVDVDADFSDMFSNLNFAMSLHTEFHVNDWRFVIDPTYLSLEMDAGVPPVAPQDGGNPTVEVDIWMVEAWVGYQANEWWELIGGARYQSQDITLVGLPNPPFPPDAGVSESWTDWFLGVRFRYDLNDKWLFTTRFDAGAGDSDTSINANLFFNRRIGKSMALNLGYRYFVNDFNEEGVYRWDVTQNGPIIGYTWTF